MLSFLASPIAKYVLGAGLIIAILSFSYCQGRNDGYSKCMEKGYKDALKREDEYNRIKDKRDEEYRKITDDLPSADDDHKSDLLSRRPYKH